VRLFSWVWAVVAALLSLLTLLALVSSISEAGSNATYASRSPGALIVIAVIGVAVGTCSVHSAWGTARDRPRRIGTRGGLALTALTALLILLYALVNLVSGPL
jgi:hypothetical protein